MPRHRHATAGFTLIETVLAIILFFLVLAGLATLPVTVVHSNNRARGLSEATNLLRDKVEELRAAAFASVASGSDPAPIDAGGVGGQTQSIYTRTWTVTGGPTPRTKLLNVQVAWADNQQISVQTLVAK